MDPQLVLMLAGGTLLLLNGFIGASGRGASSQGDLPERTSVFEQAYEEPAIEPSEDGDLREA